MSQKKIKKKKNWAKKNLGKKKIWVKKNLSKKNLGQKKIWIQKIERSKRSSFFA